MALMVQSFKLIQSKVQLVSPRDCPSKEVLLTGGYVPLLHTDRSSR